MKQRWLFQLLAGMLTVLLLCVVPTHAVALFRKTERDTVQQTQSLGQTEWFLNAFEAEESITRAQLAYALASDADADLSDRNSEFSDVPSDDRYAAAIKWAVKKGFLHGQDTKFHPKGMVSYEQLSAVLIAVVNDNGTVLPRVRKRGTLFEHAQDCADGYLDAMYTLYRAEILKNAVQPKADVTQGELADILMRLHEIEERTAIAPAQQAITISHKGDCVNAPENTREAFTRSDQSHFQYVETDVRFTSDNVPVLSHDDTIDRMANGTGAVALMPFAQLQLLDFSGGKKGYAGTRMMTFADFLTFCEERYLHPYIELKTIVSEQQLTMLRNMVADCGMTEHVTWISFYEQNLQALHAADPKAELGYLVINANEDAVQRVKRLKGENNVYLCARYQTVTQALLAKCLRENVYVETWTIANKTDAVKQLNTSIQGITVDGITIADLYR